MSEEQRPDFLSVEDVIDLHDQQIDLFGGTNGLRDRGSLESAVGMPQQGFSGRYVHPTLFNMAAAYAFHIAENQPFLDGNKRTGVAAAIAFLGLNGYEVQPSDELAPAMISISVKDLDKARLADLFQKLAVKR
jgi:death on curing protein